MKVFKNWTYLILLCLFSYVTVQKSVNTDLVNLYNGISFDSNTIFVINEFILFMCYSMFVFNKFETYLNDYGIHIVIREKSRGKLFLRMFGKLITYILGIELVKTICFLCFMILLKGEVTIRNPLEIFKMFILKLSIFFLMLFVQMILEIYISGKIALVVSLSYYVINIGLGAEIANTKTIINAFLIPNLSMKLRLDVILKDYQLSYETIFLIIIFLVLIFVSGSKFLFNKKDII